ncbi:hypothetical protein HERIO_427 [Hepatospora eriocheir]|uniref:RLA2 n=1 Tax=Hepatospora eriocheir TaxID=1081669 RepID=A0A1X0QDH0_9MICR|nr:hypothetical protein HERIO_427 [Hepatospora eriocheir]
MDLICSYLLCNECEVEPRESLIIKLLEIAGSKDNEANSQAYKSFSEKIEGKDISELIKEGSEIAASLNKSNTSTAAPVEKEAISSEEESETESSEGIDMEDFF